MAKTHEEYQREMAQLLCNAGEAQFMSRMYKKLIEEQNNQLNTLNQKIDKIKQEMFANFKPTAVPNAPIAEQPAENASDATTPAQNIPSAS